MRSTTLKIIIGVVLIGVLSLLLSGTYIYMDCKSRENPPMAPIYPGSKLVSFAPLGTGRYPIYSYEYTSEDPYDRIVAFYSLEGRCLERNWGALCIIEKNLAEKYIIHIDKESFERKRNTRYTVEIQWRTCKGELF